MCHTWQHPSKKDEEFKPDLVNKIPDGLKFINITGGEPLLRDDLDQILQIALRKTKRLVVECQHIANGKMCHNIVNSL